MTAWAQSLNRNPAARAWIAAELSAGATLGFFIVHDDGSKSLSHTIERHRGAFHVFGWDETPLGRFATLARAVSEGFAASALTLDHGL